MAHTIQSYISQFEFLVESVREFQDGRIIPLTQGFALLLASDDFYEEIARNFSGESSELENEFKEFYFPSRGCIELGRLISLIGPVAYIETEYFGGVGT